MVSNRIEQEVLVEAPVGVVWSVVTEPHQIAGWFCDAAEIDLRPGGVGTLTWDLRATNERATVQILIESVERPHTFSFRWMHPLGAEAKADNSLLVEFTLLVEGENTRVRVIESGLVEIGWSAEAKAKFADEHSKGWAVHAASLRAYVSQRSPALAPQ